MGQLDHFASRARARRVEQKVDFIGSVDGAPENGLKRALILEFVTRPMIQRAYLAQATSAPDAQPGLALCLVSSQSGDQSVVTRAGEIFGRTFPKDAVLDVVFLSPEQEAELRRVCEPFYSRLTPAGT